MSEKGIVRCFVGAKQRLFHHTGRVAKAEERKSRRVYPSRGGFCRKTVIQSCSSFRRVASHCQRMPPHRRVNTQLQTRLSNRLGGGLAGSGTRRTSIGSGRSGPGCGCSCDSLSNARPLRPLIRRCRLAGTWTHSPHHRFRPWESPCLGLREQYIA